MKPVRHIAYLVSDSSGAPVLRVLKVGALRKSSHRNFPLDIQGIARLGSECAAVLHSHVQREGTWVPRKTRRAPAAMKRRD